MTLGETLISAWQQVLSDGRDDIELGGETYPVTVSRAKGLRTVVFNVGPYRMVGIEQNPRTGSRWAMLAGEGKRIMQFRCKGFYVANVCEGKLVLYPAWKTLQLPE
jgi:predicted secreted protein